jgi:N-acetylmuramoyl-L-alanine amidase
MPPEHSNFARITTLLLLLLAAGFATEPRKITVYAPRTNYQVDILAQGGVDYVGLTDLLEPLGRLESRSDGSKLKFIFNGAETDFEANSRQVRARGNPVPDLPANFLLLNGRGYVPVASIVQLLPRIANQAAEFHTASRRLFVGSTQLHFAAELRHAPSRLVLTFPAPVNPSVVVEKSRVRLSFRREPVVGNGTGTVPYGDPFLASTSFSETPNGAEFIANVQQPATVVIGDAGRTVTISAQAAPVPSAVPPPLPNVQPNPPAAPPPPRPRPFVILDAAHGGDDSGAALSPTLLEKTVNLALARRLQKELEARGIPVVLTRVADNSLTLDQRATSANTSHAALYVAIHASTSGHGVRLYTSMVTLQPGQARRSFSPWELAQSPYLQQSSLAAAALAAQCATDGLPVRRSTAPLRPLNNVTLAAVALEVAPLGSSPDELATPEYQQSIATSLASAIASLRGKLEEAQ